jgi:hypothetical protein
VLVHDGGPNNRIWGVTYPPIMERIPSLIRAVTDVHPTNWSKNRFRISGFEVLARSSPCAQGGAQADQLANPEFRAIYCAGIHYGSAL